MDGAATVRQRDRLHPELIELLETVEFGGSGLRYRRKSLADTLNQAGPTRFLYVEDKDTVVAGYALTQSRARLSGRDVMATYRGLLAVDPGYRRRSLGRQLVATALEQQEAEYGTKPGLSFGLVEAANESSLRLLETMGARDAGHIESRLVYRQWPRSSGALRRLDNADLGTYRERLRSNDPIEGLVLRASKRLPAFGLISGGDLAAAARVGVATIDLGPGGPLARFLHRHGYARFQALGKRYNRRALRYLTIHDPFVSATAEDWRGFIDALLAQHQLHMALFTLDPRSEIATALEDAGMFGRFALATRRELRLLVSAWNLDEDWLDRIRRAPLTGGPVY